MPAPAFHPPAPAGPPGCQLRCPRCGDEGIHLWGRRSGVQRYRCARCRRCFNDRTGTPVARSRYPDRWGAMAACLAEGLSVRETARRLGIHPSTAFRWRHRLLAGLAAGFAGPLAGIVEVAEVGLRPSHKGSRQQPPARPVPPDARVFVVFACDRKMSIAFTVVGTGARQGHLAEFLRQVLSSAARVCADRPWRFRYAAVAAGRRFARMRVDRWGVVRGRAYGSRHAGPLAQGFVAWLERFRGVASRYLHHYAAGYAFLVCQRVPVPVRLLRSASG